METVAKTWKEQKKKKRNLEEVENLILSLPLEKQLQIINSKE